MKAAFGASPEAVSFSLQNPAQQVEPFARIFREEKARIVARLIRLCGDLDRAEDVFSEALEAALRNWPAQGVPANPGGWLYTVARRKGIDALRRDAVLSSKLPLVAEADVAPEDEDTRLSLIFTCCHPSLAEEARVALTLRTVGGLTTPEIARAFLLPEATLAQRVVRAQRKIRDAGIPYRVPPPELLQERLEGVLAVLYLIYNEGYWSTAGQDLVRVDLSLEALRLGAMLLELMPLEAEVTGLQALMILQRSRLPARTDANGELVPLEEQDRSLWDRRLIQEGLRLLDRARQFCKPGPYQLQAAITGMHCVASRPEATDWEKIVQLYDALLHFHPGEVVRLNRAVALAMARGPAAGLELLAPLEKVLGQYAPYHAARADLLVRRGEYAAAVEAYQRTLGLELNAPSRRYLEGRLNEALQRSR